MSTNGLGVGLISGLDYQSLVDKLIAAEAKPRDLLVKRMTGLDAQKAAYMDISARITALLSRVEVLRRTSSFQNTTATSSLEDVLGVSSGAGAALGSFSFVVRALAATHQAVSRGYAATDAALSSGTLTIESAAARADRATRLEELNGFAGVQRGGLKIIDADGKEATISIADAVSLGDVIDRINAAGLAARAEVRGDGLVLTSTSTAGTGTLRVEEVGGGQTAAGLGFAAGNRSDADADGEIVGSNVVFLSGTTPLGALNDGLGLRASLAGGDFGIKVGSAQINVDLSETIKPETRLARLNHGQGVRLGTVKVRSRDGTEATVDLSGARTVSDVETALESAFANGRLSVVMSGGRLLVTDSTTLSSTAKSYDFSIEDVTGNAARDLGINGTTTDGKISGRTVLRMDTLADVLTAINYAAGNEGTDKEPLVVAALRDDGFGITLEGQAAGAITIEAGTATRSQALADLGLTVGTFADIGGGVFVTGQRIMGGLDTVLLKTLNGGAGLVGGTIHLATDAGGADVDLSSAATLSDVVRLISTAASDAALGVTVGLDSNGTRLVVRHEDGGTGPITVSDVSGDFAAASGLAQTGEEIRSDDLQRRYVSENTALTDLNAGRGVSLGKFKITNSMGISEDVNLGIGSIKTVQDVIDEINRLNIGITARINDTGDGLLLEDTAGGAADLKVEEAGGTTARDLNILGTASEDRIDGSFEYQLDIGGGETLESLATRIGAETTLATGTILNDGTGLTPHRLSVSARASGTAGELIFSGAEDILGLTTLTQASDARLLYGNSPTSGVLLTSSSNTFDGVVKGLTLTASSVSDDVVTVTVAESLDSVIEAFTGLVEDYNGAIDRIAEVTDYDSETQTAGILLGSGTLQMVESRLFRMFSGARATDGRFDRLSEIGLSFGEGAKLEFDEDKFKDAFAADPDAVLALMTTDETGVGAVLKTQIEALTNTEGVIGRQTETLTSQKDDLQKRVENMNDLLDRKRLRLMAQFQAMESALSLMQSQQAALANLASLANATSASNNGS